LFATAAQLCQIQFALRMAQFAIAPLLDAIGQVFGDLLLEPAEHERAQFSRKPPARDPLRGDITILLGARFVSITEMILAAEVSRLNEIGNAPKVEQPILQRRAGQSEALGSLHLLDG